MIIDTHASPYNMKCIQGSHILLFFTFLVLAIITKIVGFSQDEYRWEHFNRFRHHHHLPSSTKQQLQASSKKNIPTFRTTKAPSSKTKLILSPDKHHASRRIEEAVHAFHAFSTTWRPQTYKKSTDDADNIKKSLKNNVNQMYHNIPFIKNDYKNVIETTAKRFAEPPSSSFPVSTHPPHNNFGKNHHKGKSLENFEQNDDYYYYNDDDDDDDDHEDADDGDDHEEKIEANIKDKDSIIQRHHRLPVTTRIKHVYNVKDEEDYDVVDIEDDSIVSDLQHFAQSDNNGETKDIFQDYLNDGYYNYVDDQPDNGTTGRSHSLTEDKWRYYGTADAVEKSRRRHLSAEDSVTAHITRVHYQAECRFPRPKIIQISEASKRFVPHCTVLHRCGDDTGCCHSDTQTCSPRSSKRIHLDFYVITVGTNQPVIESLLFDNHTECHCVERSRIRSTVLTPINSSESNTNPNCECVGNFEVFEEEEEDESFYSNGSTRKVCRCDCVSDNRSCEQLKKGMEGFSVDDRRCIVDGRCTAPTCEYGQYNRRNGRCPKMQEKFETARRLSFEQDKLPQLV